MKRIEEVYRELLNQKNRELTQSELARTLNISLSIVNLALKPLKRMNAVKVKQRGFVVTDAKKILYYWASIRNIDKDVIYKTRAEKQVRKIEAEMPSDTIYGAYSAYKFMFKDVPADYSEVYVYSENATEIEKRFPKNDKTPNLFVIKKDTNMKKMTEAQLFVDLWNIREWYAKEFIKEFEKKSINKINEANYE